MRRTDTVGGMEIRWDSKHTHKCALRNGDGQPWTLLQMNHMLVERRIRRHEGLPWSPKMALSDKCLDAWLNAAD